MGARQEVRFGDDRTNLRRRAAVDALAVLQDGGADDFGFQLLDQLDAGHDALRVEAVGDELVLRLGARFRSEEHTSELQSLMRISYAVFFLTKTKNTIHTHTE